MSYFKRVHTENVVLDIGDDIGALMIYTQPALRNREVLERRVNGQTVFVAIFPALLAGHYTIWGNATRSAGEITIVGGEIAEVDWRDITGNVTPNAGTTYPHEHSASWQRACATDLLPPRYRNRSVSAAPMGTAPMCYTDDGEVAWQEMWTDFCDLALAGGPPHRGDLLEPVTPDEVKADLEGYERVVAEIERGLRLVTSLPTVRSEKLGWVGLRCTDEEMALWLLRAIVVENVCVRREGCILYLPAGPAFRMEKEIKNVITVVAKTHHYWTEHIAAVGSSSSSI